MEIESTQQKLEEALSSLSPDAVLIESLKAALEAAYKEEELYWRQRSRILWLQSGDRNTSYFHAATRGRRALNKFSVIEDADGKAVYKEPEIVQSITEYYSRIFTSQMSDSSLVVQDGISPMVTNKMNETLIALPSPLEVREALFSINPEKAPGPDGFSASFYQTFWDIIGEEVVKDIQAFFVSSALDPRQNETHVRLIPKITCPKKVADYRPIALCNTH